MYYNKHRAHSHTCLQISRVIHCQQNSDVAAPPRRLHCRLCHGRALVHEELQGTRAVACRCGVRRSLQRRTRLLLQTTFIVCYLQPVSCTTIEMGATKWCHILR